MGYDETLHPFIPEPLTMAGVFLGIVGLARYAKRRMA